MPKRTQSSRPALDSDSDDPSASTSQPRAPATPSNAKRAPKGTPRVTKKAQAAAAQAHREAYAQSLFTELNTLVFSDGLPAETKLRWSKTLLTTAGRARWHR